MTGFLGGLFGVQKNNRELIRPKMMTELQGNTVRKWWLNCYSLVAIANQKNHQLAVSLFRSVQTSNPDLLTFFTLKNEQ